MMMIISNFGSPGYRSTVLPQWTWALMMKREFN